MPEGAASPDAGWTLTAHDALARQLREQANLERSRGAVAVWEAPRIATFSRWCIDQWSASWPSEQLLSATQELVLWRQAIERDALHLLAPQATAREARRADQLLRRYQIEDTGPALGDEHRAFRRWRTWVQQRMDAQGWITAADIAPAVADRVLQGEIAAPGSIRLAGFVDPLSPAEARLCAALAERGCVVEYAAAGDAKTQVEFHACDSDDAQFRAVALAVREALAEGEHSLLIALPDVEARRAPLEAALREFVAPWVADGADDAPWRWLQGQRLADQPWIDVMLDVLQLAPEGNEPSRISRLLLSTVLFLPREREASSQVEYALRERGAPQVRLTSLARQLPGEAGERFAALDAILKQVPRAALPSDWAQHFQACLGAIGWPGRQELDSHSFQAVSAGRDLLDRLGTLDAQLGRVPASTARQWPQELAGATPFAARADHLQPVRIASLEEAASLGCQRLFVLDADSARLPAAARPSPLLPLELQRAAGVPEAAPETWLERSRRQVSALLCGCAPRVRVSASRVDGSGAELMPSCLFAEAADWANVQAPERIGAVEQVLQDDRALGERPASDPVPAVSEGERDGLRPGVRLLESWFEAPFFAFCTERLGVRELSLPARGISSALQGQVLHQVLQDFYRKLPEQAALKLLGEAGREREVDALLDRHVAEYLPQSDFGSTLVALERGRMRAVLLEWLRHECQRIDPFKVIATEGEARPRIGGLQFSLRIDRVDRVRSALGPRCLVVDYKTGRQADPRGWRAEKAPQLPLYASHAARELADIGEVNGVCFAHLKEGHPALSACTDWRKKLIEEPEADLGDDWRQKLAIWRREIEGAVNGFLAGTAPAPGAVGAFSFNAALLQLAGTSPDEDGE